MIPRFRPPLGWRELAVALRPPRRDDLERFEQAFAREMGQKHAIAFPYGRTGLMLTLAALGIEDREVVCPAYTCVVVPHAIVYSGNRPVFVDCRPGSCNMDLDRAEAAIGEHTGALIATSLFGEPVDLDRLAEIRRRHPGLPIIQDCAHSFAAEWRGHPVHQAGVAAIYGLNVSKLVTSIFGGMVTSDDDELAARLRSLQESRLRPAGLGKSVRRLLYLLAVYPAFWPPLHGLVDRLERSGWLDRWARYYEPGTIDMPADYLEALTPVEARVGRVQIGRYRTVVARRRRVAALWRDRLASEPGISLPPPVPGSTYSHFAAQVDDRAAWVRRWRQRGVRLGEVIDYSIPELEAYREHAGDGSFPLAARYARSTVNFPLSPDALRAAMVGGPSGERGGRQSAVTHG